MDFEEVILNLEKRIRRLESRDNRLMHLVDSGRDPLQFFILEYDLDEIQVKGICEFMEIAYTALVKKKEPLTSYAFEKEMLPYIPVKNKPSGIAYDFVKGLLLTFSKTGQWHEVVEYYRHDFNVP